MTRKVLPSIQALNNPNGVEWDAPTHALDNWQPVKSAHGDDENTINILDQIGESWDGSGMTSKIVSSVLRKAAGSDVTVNINSPGGDFFEGITIYNQLREYDGIVNINVLGVAASAASIIAMGADELKIAKAGFLMIHNSWGIVVGNQNDMRDAADTFAVFDAAMANVYADRSGNNIKEIKSLMNKDAWMTGETAVTDGYADSFLPSDEIVGTEAKIQSSTHKINLALAKGGMARSERRALLKGSTGTPSAAEITPSADDNDPAMVQALSDLLADVKGKTSDDT